MSSLLSDLTVWVVKITLTKRSDATTVDWYFALDYWASGSTLFTSNPVIYPLLAAEPIIKRGVGIYAGKKYDVSVDLFAKTNLDKHHVTFLDQLELYEIHNAKVEFRMYQKPIDASAGAHSDSTHIQQVCRVVDTRYDEDAGILSLNCRDVFFKDREVSKKLQPASFDALQESWIGEYGSIVFGQSTVAGEGIVIDAPWVWEQHEAVSPSSAFLFAGWKFGSHETKAVDRLIARNRNKSINSDEWVTVGLTSTAHGDSVSSPVADPPNWPRDLSRFARGIVYTPAADTARLLTSMSAEMSAPTYMRCADIIEGQHFYNSANPDYLSAGDADLTGEIWINPDTVGGSGGQNRIICAQGDSASGTLEWMLGWDPSGDNKVWFGISVDGTTLSTTAKYGTALSTSTWYHIVFQHDKSGNAVGIYVNNNTVVTNSTGANVMTRRNGPFHIGKNINSDLGFDGKCCFFRYWNRLITGTDVSNLYNSGQGVFTELISDTISQGMRCSNELNEPYGIREDSRGSAHLSEGTTSTSLSQVIGYAYSAKTVTLDSTTGDAVVNIYEAKTEDSGDTYQPIGTPVRSWRMAPGSLDITLGVAYADPTFVMAPEVPYLVTIEFSNQRSNVYFLLCEYESNGGSTHYAADVRREAIGYAKQTDIRVGLKLQFMAAVGLSTDNVDGVNPFSYYSIQNTIPTIGDSGPDMTKDLELKLGVKGLKDDGSGTYTGSAAAVIENPSDIIRFVLMNSDFGLGLTSDDVDTSSLTTARSDLSTLGITHKIVIDRQTYAEDLILEVARQARACFYKTKVGKLALKVFAPINNSYSAVLSEAFHRGDFILLGVDDNDYGTVVNYFSQSYGRDIVTQPADIAFARSHPETKKPNLLELNPDGSSTGDTFREDVCDASQNLFGRREHTAPLSHFDSEAGAAVMQNYMCDRYSSLQKRAVARIYAGDFYTSLDLFSNVHLQHTGIPASDGTTLRAKAHYQGTPIVCYSEGVPCVVWSGGGLGVQVYEVEMQGAWMLLVGETVSQF